MSETSKQSSKQRDKVLEELRHVSSTISELCRYIGFGVAGASYAIFSSNSHFAERLLYCQKTLLIAVAITAVLAILLDYLQFLCGFLSVRKALGNDSGDYHYNSKSVFYRARFQLFYYKQACAGFCVVLLLATLILVI